MGGEIYEYWLSSDTDLMEIDKKLGKMLKEDNLDHIAIYYGFPGDLGEGEDHLTESNSLKNKDGRFLIFHSEKAAFDFVCEYKGYGGRLEEQILYVTHVKDDKDPCGWSYYVFGAFYRT